MTASLSPADSVGEASSSYSRSGFCRKNSSTLATASPFRRFACFPAGKPTPARTTGSRRREPDGCDAEVPIHLDLDLGAVGLADVRLVGGLECVAVDRVAAVGRIGA